LLKKTINSLAMHNQSSFNKEKDQKSIDQLIQSSNNYSESDDTKGTPFEEDNEIISVSSEHEGTKLLKETKTEAPRAPTSLSTNIASQEKPIDNNDNTTNTDRNTDIDKTIQQKPQPDHLSPKLSETMMQSSFSSFAKISSEDLDTSEENEPENETSKEGSTVLEVQKKIEEQDIQVNDVKDNQDALSNKGDDNSLMDIDEDNEADEEKKNSDASSHV